MKKAVLLFLLCMAFSLNAQTTHHLDWYSGILSAQASITIEEGDTVIWTFTDGTPHSVTNDPGSTETFDSGIIAAGSTYTYTFTQVGSNPYHCDVHPSMVGVITVTSAAPACTDPSNLASSNVTGSTGDISWTENGTASEWEVEYGVSGFAQGTGTVINVTGNPSASLAGLNGCTAYDVYVRAVCGSTTSNWVGPHTFNTTAIDPSNLTCSINITSTTTGVSWTENGSATEWEIKLGPIGFNPMTQGTLIPDSDGVPDEILTGLTPDTQYEVYVRSFCDGTTSNWTGPCSFNTATAGVSDPNFAGFEFYPNPAKNEITLKANHKIEQIWIYNVLGQKLMHIQSNKFMPVLKLSGLNAGNYFMKISINGATETFAIIKQ